MRATSSKFFFFFAMQKLRQGRKKKPIQSIIPRVSRINAFSIQCLDYKTLKLAKSLDEDLPITRISGGRYSFIFGTIFWSGTIYKIGRKTKFQYQSIRNQ